MNMLYEKQYLPMLSIVSLSMHCTKLIPGITYVCMIRGERIGELVRERGKRERECVCVCVGGCVKIAVRIAIIFVHIIPMAVYPFKYKFIYQFGEGFHHQSTCMTSQSYITPTIQLNMSTYLPSHTYPIPKIPELQ
jgi:hypothetical protein